MIVMKLSFDRSVVEESIRSSHPGRLTAGCGSAEMTSGIGNGCAQHARHAARSGIHAA